MLSAKSQLTKFITMKKYDSLEIISAVMRSLRTIYRSDCIYKKAGVIVSGIVPKSQIQLSFFDNISDIEKRHRLMQAMDTMNDSYGRMKIRFAINENSL